MGERDVFLPHTIHTIMGTMQFCVRRSRILWRAERTVCVARTAQQKMTTMSTEKSMTLEIPKINAQRGGGGVRCESRHSVSGGVLKPHTSSDNYSDDIVNTTFV